ncbi:MAG: hypothetical protein JSW25_06330, partial [Thermoplasmata archaeon]
VVKIRHIAALLLLCSIGTGPFFIEFYIDYYILDNSSDIEQRVIIVLPFVILIVIGSIMALIGAGMAAIGNGWRRTMVFASFSILTLGPFFVGSMLGFTAIVMIAASPHEFKDKKSLDGNEPGVFIDRHD